MCISKLQRTGKKREDAHNRYVPCQVTLWFAAKVMLSYDAESCSMQIGSTTSISNDSCEEVKHIHTESSRSSSGILQLGSESSPAHCATSRIMRHLDRFSLDMSTCIIPRRPLSVASAVLRLQVGSNATWPRLTRMASRWVSSYNSRAAGP